MASLKTNIKSTLQLGVQLNRIKFATSFQQVIPVKANAFGENSYLRGAGFAPHGKNVNALVSCLCNLFSSNAALIFLCYSIRSFPWSLSNVHSLTVLSRERSPTFLITGCLADVHSLEGRCSMFSIPLLNHTAKHYELIKLYQIRGDSRKLIFYDLKHEINEQQFSLCLS